MNNDPNDNQGRGPRPLRATITDIIFATLLGLAMCGAIAASLGVLTQ